MKGIESLEPRLFLYRAVAWRKLTVRSKRSTYGDDNAL